MTEQAKRFILHPGLVRSRVDGDTHFITAARLCELYGVHPNKCLAAYWSCWDIYVARHFPDAVHLYPRTDGNYTLPGAAHD